MQTQTVVLNVAPGGVPPIVYATQNDNGRTVRISVMDGASGYSLSDSYTYVICGTKPSGTGFSYNDKVTKIGSSMLSFDVNTVMTAVAGPVRCGIIIYDGDQHVETLAFILQVQESALAPETVIDSNDFQSIIESAVRDYIEEAGLVVDDTLSVSGAAADAKKTGDEINDLKSAIDLGSLTPGVKSALLACFDHVAWDDDDPTGQTYINALYDALYNRYWQVTNALTNCTTSNASEQTIKGQPYSATITASTGYVMSGATVSITMGGVDITATAYSNGVISIPAVTGALVITISAAAVGVSSISAVYTQPGTIYPTDSMDDLKNNLVVTATMEDSTTAIVPAADYTLSGTLAAGTSTITVTYRGKTATFSVAVTGWDFAWDFTMGKLEEQDGWGVDKSASGVTSSITSDGEVVVATSDPVYLQPYMSSTGSLASLRTMSNGYGVVECIMSGIYTDTALSAGQFRVYAVQSSSKRIVVYCSQNKWRIYNATGGAGTPIADCADNTDYKIRLVLKDTVADVYINDELVAHDVDTGTMVAASSNGMTANPKLNGRNITFKAFRMKVGSV